MRKQALSVLAALAVAGCDGGSDPAPVPRPFVMGFTDFPYAATFQAIDDVYRYIATDGDFVNHHFDGGVPWVEALAGGPLPAAIESEIATKLAKVPRTHRTLVTATPVNFLRTGLADYRGGQTAGPLPAPWDTVSFDNPIVEQAFLVYAERLIERLEPKYFAYTIEANILADKNPARWASYVRLARALYTELKRRHPALLVFPTIQLELLREKGAPQVQAVRDLLPYADVIAVSTYPYASLVAPASIGPAYYDPVRSLAPEKPFAVAETAWPAETITAPYPIVIAADQAQQRTYVERLLAAMTEMDALFINYFFTRDYDQFWESDFKKMEIAPLVRIWKDTGLYAGDGTERPALDSWRKVLARPRR